MLLQFRLPKLGNWLSLRIFSLQTNCDSCMYVKQVSLVYFSLIFFFFTLANINQTFQITHNHHGWHRLWKYQRKVLILPKPKDDSEHQYTLVVMVHPRTRSPTRFLKPTTTRGWFMSSLPSPDKEEPIFLANPDLLILQVKSSIVANWKRNRYGFWWYQWYTHDR